MYRSPKILKSSLSGSACVRSLVKDVEAVKENLRNTARHLSLLSRITPVFKESNISAVGDQTIRSCSSWAMKFIREQDQRFSKRIEELIVEKIRLEIEKTEREKVFSAIIRKSFMDFIFSDFVEKYMPKKENGLYTNSQLIDGYTQFLNSNDDLALLLKKKFPKYSSEDLGFRISELHRRLSSFVGTVHETAILSCNVEDVMKVMSGRPFKCADPVLVRTIDSVMEAYYEFSWGKAYPYKK